MSGFFILSTKRESNIYALLGILLVVTTLKTPFSSSLAIFFCLDAVYWAGDASVFSINTSNLSITKHISVGAVMLACSNYFLDCSSSCLTRAREARISKGDLAVYSIG